MENKKFNAWDGRVNELTFEVIEHGLLNAGSEWDIPKVVSPFNRLYFVLDGDGYVVQNGKRVNLETGFAYLIPAGTCYSYKANHFINKLYIHFQIQLIPGVDMFSRCVSIMKYELKKEEVERLITLFEGDTWDTILETKSFLLSVIARFIKKASQEGVIEENYSGFEKQQKVINYLQSHLTAELKISQIAEGMGLSYHHLSRSFKRDTKMGLKEYMAIVLMNKARRLLLTTDLRILEIAEIMGFADAYYFSKFFRKYEKISPREYRKSKIE